jgi:flagellar hook protein FlgE
MGLYSLLTTSASGMAAQSAWLNAISDNIANVSTIGYKQASTEFSSLVLSSGLTADYQSGSVIVDPRIAIDGQGALNSTTSTTDLAVQGNGFFIVQGPNNQPVLTRVGSFVKDSAGDLVNAAGYTLLGYPTGKSGVANGFSGLVPVNLNSIALQAIPTTSGKLYVNAPSTAAVVAPANLPSANAATATPTAKTSLVTYDNLGNQVTLDVYLTNEGGNVWDVAIFNAADAPASGGFPYTAGPLTTGTLTFDPTTGAIQAGTPTSFNVAIPNGSTITLDMSQTTQLATSYTVLTASTNGNAPSQVSGVNIANNGTVSVAYQNGSSASVYTVPLATVPSPDKMTVISGNAYVPDLQSGAAQIGVAGAGGLGTIQSSMQEASTVDLATELTSMIAAQNNYQADSKVFTTGSQLLQVLINLGK